MELVVESADSNDCRGAGADAAADADAVQEKSVPSLPAAVALGPKPADDEDEDVDESIDTGGGCGDPVTMVCGLPSSTSSAPCGSRESPPPAPCTVADVVESDGR